MSTVSSVYGKSSVESVCETGTQLHGEHSHNLIIMSSKACIRSSPPPARSATLISSYTFLHLSSASGQHILKARLVPLT